MNKILKPETELRINLVFTTWRGKKRRKNVDLNERNVPNCFNLDCGGILDR